MKPINVGLLGLGTVGAGTIDVLMRNRDVIARRAGREIRVTHATARDLTKPRNVPLDGITLVGDPFELVTNPEIDIVCELIGGDTSTTDLVFTEISVSLLTSNVSLALPYLLQSPTQN